MTPKIGLIEIPSTQQFSLPQPNYEDGSLIRKVCMLSNNGTLIVVRPAKLKGKVQPTQEIVVSPFLSNRIANKGTVIFISKDGVATQFKAVSKLLAELSVKSFG